MSLAEEDLTRGPGAGIARGAALIAGLTVVSRLFGLTRTLVFSQTVGASCLGTAYVTANQVPNLLYELVLGGALTSAMVPVLARSAERAADDPADRALVSQITSALLTWSVIILVPLTLAIAAAADPIASLLNPANAHEHCARANMVADTATMLQVFAPQALLYGLSVVLYGLLQAYRRFAAPTLGPAISSLVVISSYLAFAPLTTACRWPGSPGGRACPGRWHDAGRRRTGPGRRPAHVAAAPEVPARPAVPAGVARRAVGLASSGSSSLSPMTCPPCGPRPGQRTRLDRRRRPA